MRMLKYTNAKRRSVLGLCATSKFIFGATLILFCFKLHNCYDILFYRAYGSGKEDSPICDVPGFENARMKLLRYVSFVDCPVKHFLPPEIMTIKSCACFLHMYSYIVCLPKDIEALNWVMGNKK